MKQTLIALLGAMALSTSAYAADIGGGKSAKDEPRGFMAPVARDSAFGWTRAWGFVGGGYGMTNTETSSSKSFEYEGEEIEWSNSAVDGVGGEGIFAEVQVGLDYQMDRIVLGVYGGASLSDAETSASSSDWAGLFSQRASIEQLESYFAGARVGALLSDSAMVYVGAGWRWTNFEGSGSVSLNGEVIPESRFSDKETLDGAFVETGLEGRMSQLVGWKVFGRYTFYEDQKESDKADDVPFWHDSASDMGELQFGAGLTISVGSPVEKLF